MQIVMLNGGLGNQLFQFFFYIYLRENVKDICLIDDSFFCGKNVAHNGYEIERIFDCKARRLSQFFPKDVWDYFIKQISNGDNMPSLLNKAGLPLLVAEESMTGKYSYSGKKIEFCQKQSPITNYENVYYYGYWLGNYYLNKISDKARAELKFPPLNDANRLLGRKIQQSKNATAIHVRRGDMAQLGWTAPASYYAGVIRFLETKYNVDRYFLFSDDIEWCIRNAEELGLNMIADKMDIVHGNKGDDAYIDMQLMAMCRNRVSDRSSFSQLAGYLCPHKDGININNWRKKQY